MKRLGLIGKHISYSFSKGYFTEKFKKEDLDFSYENFDLELINEFPRLLNSQSDIIGFNVTIPYKEAIIPYLDNLSKKAKKIGAVNTIRITKKGKLKGYNTDFYGFSESLKPFLKKHHKKALILGTGGASKAISFALKKHSIKHDYVSRNRKANVKFTYDSLTKETIASYQIIINCTPLGTYPKVNDCPPIPYDGISDQHLLYDLIYNPEETKFLRIGKSQGAQVTNGYKMLIYQAEKAWDIWNKVN
ncbi:shikimate dehydrogenase [Psychroserpens sp.]|uniref:shikimate dehydrogenase family protein n=1 Tax=Psychroserpens sp. TaxID=2020870 RepID=UPI001B0309A2|nr:shikimate dehydrogenase [Psychroserpens sp.]MBO6606302.1 shikimate dehydrogenase [Psychroserpens sp.]MBO6632841.1 shikimate dehydrogenase [Psychroserpens sp.]MBO6653006.1 shikimate dehydrogenase [Psychroserpens sp.]MBO6680967.1 shikimate dehydrogenase [Psychroserpens sp.]MBO6750077.1 shikimate dehydrogenase [Psychroserpens sp.]